MEQKNLVYSAAILYSIIIGLSFLFGKIALAIVDPIELLAYRFTASLIVVLALLLFKKIRVNYTFQRVRSILPLAILYPLAFFAFQTFGLQYASSSEAGIITASTPVFTLILATLFLKEKTNTWQRVSIMASVAGVIFITLMKGTTLEIESITGITLILLSALSFSGYSVLARILTRDFSSMELTVMMIIISFVCFNATAICKNVINGTMAAFLAPLGNPQFILSVIYLGVLSTLITSFLTNYVLSKLEASKMSVFANLGTVISIAAGVIFLKENIFYYHVIGSILIVGGILGANFLDKHKA